MSKALMFGIILGIIAVSLASVNAGVTGKVTANVVNTGEAVATAQMIVGNDSDEHGCKGSAGYSWCEKLKECIRPWETNCTESGFGKEGIKIMPETASQRALEVLGAKCAEQNCSIVLKEVGVGNQTRNVYEVRAEKEAKLFGFIKTRMNVEAQVDAENGEVVATKKPWWSFLAKEE